MRESFHEVKTRIRVKSGSSMPLWEICSYIARKLKRHNCEIWLKRVNILQRDRHDLHDSTAISVSISVVIKHSDIGRRYRWRSLAATRFAIWLLYLTTSLRCNLFADLSLSAGKIKIFPCICHCKFTL